ncbi:MAG: 3-isopropylmalate dehydrogenase [Bacillota bacterium]|nr:3-isopropylmalate dehydrogenase [Bacillota bacterium]
MSSLRIVALPGDGIGPEVTQAALSVLEVVAADAGIRLDITSYPIGGAQIDIDGRALAPETLAACRAADAVLLGAVGGPRWDQPTPGRERPEQGLLALRAGLGVYCNLRPARLWPALASRSPLRAEFRSGGIDLVICRELTGGIYFGESGTREVTGPDGPELESYDVEAYSEHEIRRILERAVAIARGRQGRLCLVDKANVLESSRLWRRLMQELALRNTDIEVEYLYVDNAAMQLIRRPGSFDVIVTSNIFGDILSDESAEIIGSIGLMPSASLGDAGSVGLYEPIHGSAPDLAGRDLANPLATILSAALLLRYQGAHEEAAVRIERAVEAVLDAGWRTADLATPDTGAEQILGCRAMTRAVLDELAGAR